VICLRVLFLAVREDLVQKCWGGNSGLSVPAKNSSVQYFYVSQLTSCACEGKKNHKKIGRSAQIPAKSENVIPRPEERKDKFTDTPIFVD
jgi:hypothetical protein